MTITTLVTAAADEPCTDVWGCVIQKGKDAIGGVVNGTRDAIKGTEDAVNGAKATADFWSDPAGNSYKILMDAVKNLTHDVLPALTHATLPDVGAEWFLKAYATSFALSIFVFVVILLLQFVATARGHQSGQELVATLTQYGPAFILGGVFGPMAAWGLVKFFSVLTDALIQNMLATTSDTIADKFSKMLGDDDAAGIVGGAVVGVILLVFMILALLITLLVLIVQLIGLYFSGVLFPLGWVWITSARKRQFGTKIAYLWLGILASHPLLFLMLGITFQFVSSNINVLSGEPTLEKTISIVVSMLSLFITAFSPLLLFRFAPVLPMGGAGAAPGPNIGSNSPQEADERYTPSDSDADSSQTVDDGAYAPQPVEATSEAASGGGFSSSSGPSDAEKASSSALSDAAAGPAGSGGTAAAESGAAAEGAVAAEEGAMAAGAAESTTGVGAIVGVPTMVVAAGALAFNAAQDTANATADMAGSPIEDHEDQFGRHDA
ncbi:hypothetical protein ACMT9Y_15290 [Clavibacter tessellarius]|uniref:hypothetical protein n=1 Tax=Clavibacter tessellarius TaxID=31965 RepID=UPI0039EBD86E